jgi:hypothetical protein
MVNTRGRVTPSKRSVAPGLSSPLQLVQYEADCLRDNRYYVRPKGQLGTCGWYPIPWTIFYCNARSKEEALRKFYKKFRRSEEHPGASLCSLEE